MTDKEIQNQDDDARARDDIVKKIDQNFLVEAGAGSGKTTMLVNRMVAMIEKGIDISKICTITFTKAAAGEFYDRFRKRLMERRDAEIGKAPGAGPGELPAPTQASKNNCREALKKIDLCFMGTIDSFCYKLLSEHPFESGIPSHSVIISGEKVKELYRQQYARILTAPENPDLFRLAGVFQTLHRNPEEVFVKGAEFLMDRRNVDKFHYEPKESFDDAIENPKEKARLLEVLKFILDNKDNNLQATEGQTATSDKVWEQLDVIVANVEKGKHVPDILKSLTDLKNLRLSQEAKQHEILHDILTPVKANEKITESFLQSFSDRIENLRYDISMTFLMQCLPEIEKAMRSSGYVTYFDCLYYLREMLRKDARDNKGKLIKYIKEKKYGYFLIDEFQDTNPLQTEIFFYLSSDEPKEKWTDCVPRPGALFVVGDPKQSIYRFRGADVDAFERVKDLFESSPVGKVKFLTRNFRSTKALREYFNKSFPDILPGAFKDIPTDSPKDAPGKGLKEVYTYTACMKEEKNNPDTYDAARIANIIETLVDNDAYQIRDIPDGELRNIQYSDIMVITEEKKYLAPIVRKLNGSHIPTKVEGDVPFDENEALAEVCHIFSAVAAPDDKIALYGALTGKVMGLTEADILCFKKNKGSLSLRSSFDKNSCRDKAAYPVADKLDDLRKLRDATMEMTPAALFSKIVDDFQIYKFVNAANMEVLYYSLELLRAAEQDGTVTDLRAGSNFLAKLRDKKTDIERCLSLSESENRVHLANLHKVKGLEAPVVILAGNEKDQWTPDHRIQHKGCCCEGHIFQLMKSKTVLFFKTTRYEDEKNDEKRAREGEEKRLLYVAATRAKDILIIWKSDKDNKNNLWAPLLQETLPDFWASVDPESCTKPKQSEKLDSAKLYEQAEEECVLRKSDTFGLSYTVKNPSRLPATSKMETMDSPSLFDTGIPEEPDEHTEEHMSMEPQVSRRLLGTMVHRLMEMLVSSRNKINPADAIRQILQEYTTDVASKQEEEYTALLGKVAKTIIADGGYPQEGDAPKDILATLLNAEKVYCELPFCAKEKQDGQTSLLKGIIDVLYLADGKWHIIDYKTNLDATDLELEYQEQLQAYARAFTKSTNEEVDTAIYHITI